jgi:AbrB family looped-hinge helix DNA binding protein
MEVPPMSLARLSSKSQISLPAGMRRKLDIHPGDTLEITQQGDTIAIRKVPGRFVDALEGCTSPLWQDYEGELMRERSQWDR